jgi:dsDNA-specific endonuclease/ATPase MutS2
MKQEILQFIRENNLSPFNQSKTQLKQKYSIYKTTDAKRIHNRTLQKISENFIFPETSNIFNFFKFTNDVTEIKKRQLFFSNLQKIQLENSFLQELKKPKNWWKPRYDVIVVTEDAETYNKLKKMNCPVQMLISEQDTVLLEEKDVVQVINCPEFQIALESLPQAVFYKEIEEIYLERYLEEFSGHINNLEIINKNPTIKTLKELTEELFPLIQLTKDGESNSIDPDELESKIITANQKIEEKIKQLTLSGSSLIQILSKGDLPRELKQTIEETIEELKIPRQVLEIGIPLKLDEEELQKLIQHQNANEFSELAETIKNNSDKLKKIPEKLKNLNDLILYFDFLAGISKFINSEMNFPEINHELIIQKSYNIFLENPQPISFNLSENIQASILTGANSGGKTTLIEHVLQLITLTQLGLPQSGKNKFTLFEEIYYFAKNKGSNLKGAFETLLTQMSKIKPGNKTLILADEIEAVTEPGVAGNIIAATTDYYIKQNCYLIIATHLGHEIQKILPEKTRIDGIEATGLTENFELIVNHDPKLGKLAHSTPELIVEKMANKENKEYFKFLNKFLKDKK